MEFLASLHPKVVHFPIALLMVYILLELIGVVSKKEFYLKAAHLILLLGVIGSFIAVLTGNQAFTAVKNWNESAKIVFESHQNYANITVWYFTILLALRTYLVVKKRFTTMYKYIVLAVALLGFYFVYQTASYGGELVFKYQVGIEASGEKPTSD